MGTDTTMIKVYGFIFARGGSKGIPRKNLKLLHGKPLIAWSIETALKCPSIERVIVSTDDKEIAAVSKEYGAEVPFLRPKELAQDDSAEWNAWRHAIEFLNLRGELFHTFITLPATSTLGSVEDVERCIAALDQDADIIITVKKAERSPYFNMVTIDNKGFSNLAITPEKQVIRRQDAPLVYDMTTVCYVARPKFIMESYGVFSGRVRSIVIPCERAVDIDTPLDFKMAEFLANQQ